MNRFLRFRLKTFLIVVTLVAVWLGWYVHSARQQQAAVEGIKQLGGWAYYDYQIVDDKFSSTAKSWAPDWLRASLGNDFFHNVVQVNLVYNDDGPQRIDNEQTSGKALQHVSQLRKLEMLLLKEGQASDQNLQLLRNLSRLRRLYMWDASDVSDVGILKLRGYLPSLQYIHCSEANLSDVSLSVFGEMQQLEGLSLQGNRFTDRGLAHLSELIKLESLWIGLGETRITDAGLKHVYPLKKLRQFEIQNSPVSLGGLNALREVLPKLEILHGLTEKRRTASAAPASTDVDAPELLFLSNRHAPPVGAKQPWPGMYWKPNGGVVDSPKELIPLRATASPFTRTDEPHFNVFALVRDVQRAPFCEIDVLLSNGRLIDRRLLSIRASIGKANNSAPDDFWQQFVVRTPDDVRLPDTGLIRMRYTAGDWRSLAMIDAAEDRPVINVDGLLPVASADNRRGQATFSFYVDLDGGDRFEYRLDGHDKKGAVIHSTGQSRTGGMQSSYVLTFEFAESLANIAEFELFGRPKYTVDFHNVSFRPGVITSPAKTLPDGTIIQLP